MKLALARAMLMNADIMLLDEPTNHLDVTNVKWLIDYLVGLKGVSAGACGAAAGLHPGHSSLQPVCLAACRPALVLTLSPQVTSVVVSHDSGFLDAVCTSIIHYEDNFKLKKYLGNLSKFVEQRPEAAAYYNLADATTKWVLPEPGFLEVSVPAVQGRECVGVGVCGGGEGGKGGGGGGKGGMHAAHWVALLPGLLVSQAAGYAVAAQPSPAQAAPGPATPLPAVFDPPCAPPPPLLPARRA